jgi:hypothetical protein
MHQGKFRQRVADSADLADFVGGLRDPQRGGFGCVEYD